VITVDYPFSNRESVVNFILSIVDVSLCPKYPRKLRAVNTGVKKSSGKIGDTKPVRGHVRGVQHIGLSGKISRANQGYEQNPMAYAPGTAMVI
jgi:hypothetical protein